MTTKTLIEQVNVMIDETSTLFYQRKDNEGFDQLETLISQIVKVVQSIQQNDLLEKINEGLICVVEAIERKDTITIADELTHTIKPLLTLLIG